MNPLASNGRITCPIEAACMPCYREEHLGNVQGTVPVRVEMVPNPSQRRPQTLQQSWGRRMHTCLNTKNAVPTCHILGFEPPSGLRDELGFILGLTLEGRKQTLRQQAHHPASPPLCPPAPGTATSSLRLRRGFRVPGEGR